MTNFEFKLPENGNLSQSLVASALWVESLNQSDSTNAANQVNAKSLLGLFTIVLTPGTTLHFSIIGETDSYSSQSMQRKLKTLFSA